MTHDEMREQLMLLAVDALPESERREAEAHAETCPPCGELLEEYRQLVTRLFEGVPQLPAPFSEAQLRARIRAAKPQAPTPAPEIRRPAGFRLTWPRLALVGAALVLLLIFLINFLQVQPPTAADDQAEFARLLDQPGIYKVYVKGTDLLPSATGEIVLDPQTNAGFFFVKNMKALSADKTYQLWLVRDYSTRDNGGLFTVNDKGEALMRVQLKNPPSYYRELGVTIEPTGGSPGPTTPRIIGGMFR